MNSLKKELFKNQTIEIDQQIKEANIQKLMIVIENTEFTTKNTFIKNIVIQLPYIDKKSIILQLILLMMGIWIVLKNKGDFESIKTTVNTVSLIGSFLAIVDLIETYKSYQHDMWEIETVCKNNLHELMIQRYLITGSVSIIIICILSLVVTVKLQVNFLNVLLYFMIPFMFVCASYLRMMKLTKNKINDVILLGLVLFLNSFFIIFFMQIKNNIYMNFWLVITIFVVVLIFYLKEILQFIVEAKEEIEWN